MMSDRQLTGVRTAVCAAYVLLAALLHAGGLTGFELLWLTVAAVPALTVILLVGWINDAERRES